MDKNILTKKKVLKTNLTKLKDKINSNISEADSEQLKLFKTKIIELKQELTTLFENIFVNCKDEELDSFMVEKDNLEDTSDDLLLAINRQFTKTNAISSLNSSAVKSEVAELKLPKLSLPTFSGRIDEWLSFKDLFSASVHNNANLSSAQKLQYLKSSCKADASKIVQSIPIEDANYAIAWDLLSERFSNKRELVHSHIKKLMLQPSINNESAAAILNLVDTTNECVRSFEILDLKVSDFSETLIVYIILQKLDANTKLWWERQLKGDELPTLSQLTTFLKDYARSLPSTKISGNFKKTYSAKLTTMNACVNNFNVCKMCDSNNHKIYKCPEFLKLSVNDRLQIVKCNNLCFNCLNSNHRLSNCNSKKGCLKCNLRSHHSLLHFERKEKVNKKEFINERGDIAEAAGVAFPPARLDGAVSASAPIELNSCFSRLNNHKFGILATALIYVQDVSGSFQLMRVLIDVGSTSNFISEKALQLLGIKRNYANLPIKCLGSNVYDTTRGVVKITFSPHFDKQKVQTAAFYVLKNITNEQPHMKYDPDAFLHLKNITLADPKWFEPGQIDILLGVSISLAAIRGEKIFGNAGTPFAVNSEFGWLVAGDSDIFTERQPRIIVNHANVQHDYLKKFWELESVPSTDQCTTEEKYCENFFDTSHTRQLDGRYVVHLPFKRNCEKLGDSKTIAVKRFLNLEKRLLKMPDIYDSYKAFIKEYFDLGHMDKIPLSQLERPVTESFYLPHHAVIRESSTTTRLRVVFDGSCKSSTGVSLNDNLIVGPRVQQELFSILLRFRIHPIVINADITKMFRQVKVCPEHQDYQRILWRDKPSDEISEYRLTTVTYGLASSPYLSTKVLQRLAIDERLNYPLASTVALRDFYVDDLLSGASSTKEAIELVTQMQKLMQSGGFELRKWSSNDSDVLKSIPDELLRTKPDLDIESMNSTKILGLTWNSSQDVFNISVSVQTSLQEVTKRTILSDIAKIFDPLGWLSPFVISAKILLQQLWSLQLNWDEPVSLSIKNKWQEIRSELSCLTSISIPRAVVTPQATRIEMHAFSDASLRAYGAVVYLRSFSSDSTVSVRMLTAKTRVSPLKTVSLPRLELCAALLLVHLVKAVQEALCLDISRIFAWTDSTIVLSWLSAEPSRWQIFVSNRVSEIQKIVPVECWHHIKGKENPADCASRGLLPSQLPSHDLWWHGPSWLSDSTIVVAESRPHNIDQNALREERKNYLCAVSQLKCELPILTQVSSFMKLKRIIALCLRFIYNLRVQASKRKVGFIKSDEIRKAEIAIVKQVQSSVFHSDIQCIASGKCLPNSSKLINLSPFLDQQGVLRVGGRLRHANLTEDQIHPIVLPKNHPITDLVVKYYHLSHLHAGPQLLLSVIRQHFWIISGRDVVRRFVNKCITCVRVSASVSKQMMADLPQSRVKPSRPFSKTGIDYAGPFLCKARSGRGAKSFKCYVSVFVCFSTKAVHLEIVSDLSTQAFLASLRRFVARRGKPKEIFSDCATNFVGASKELKSVYKFVASSQNSEEVARFFASEGILWHFNPPSAPHFGGLWEASVKSMKFHLKRIMGNSVLTFEELSTLLTQIEACLNSRPLCPLSSDPNDLSVLTPGHFLIGAPLTALPEDNLLDIPESRLKRWQLVQRVFQHFWKRWSAEYLTNLQQRSKWCKEQPNIQVGDLVLIKNECVPSLRWKLARVKQTHPGADNRVRVVTLKTDKGELTRPIAKISKLPV